MHIPGGQVQALQEIYLLYPLISHNNFNRDWVLNKYSLITGLALVPVK